jgi:peptide/nickel transport system ATP-binding protein
MNADTPLLDVAGLDVVVSAELGLTKVVADLAITVARGETFALVGESGCGKSMTALALLRLLPDAGRITAGRIDLSGKDLNNLSERAMRHVRGSQIGIIFQEPATSLNPVMRVGDQIVETLRTHTALSGTAARTRAIEWLGRVGIPEPARRVDDYPFQFSGGQKQRVMIAIALAAEPQLLIADEPTTALDVTVQAQVLALLAGIQKELGMAMLLITHDLAVVRQTAHHVALMRRGEVIESAPADVFFRSPRHPYARELFNAIPTFEKRGLRLSKPSEGQAGAAIAETPVAAAAGPAHGAPFSDAASTAAIPDAANLAAPPAVARTASTRAAPVAGAAPLLAVDQLRVYYPVRAGIFRPAKSWIKAVDGVSFTLNPGETLALLGESGCGKTTTGRALLHLVQGAKVSGSATLAGQDLLGAGRRALKAMRKDIQIVFQDPYASLDPRMRIGAILEEGVASLAPDIDARARSAKVARLLDRVALPASTIDRYPHEFSGGQRQRIAIARALAVSPKVLICDEPTSALDVSVQAQILDLLQDLQAETGMAYLFITHNFGVVEFLADRIAVMEGGRIVEEGAAASVLRSPQQEMTRRLLAAVPRLRFG